MNRVSRYMWLFVPLVHLILIYIKGYFLSVEFTLYPYLISHGFLPYKNIIDHHFPVLFFGPFSLPHFLTTNPWPLTFIFLATTFITDVFLYITLKSQRTVRPAAWLLLYVLVSTFFSGYVMWIETFVNLLLVILFYLLRFRNNWSQLLIGFMVSLIVLLRPTIIPAIVVLLVAQDLATISTFVGILAGLSLHLMFLLNHDLIPYFIASVIEFNRSIYPNEAKLYPGSRQVIMVLIWLIFTVTSLIGQKQYFSLSIVLLSLLLIFPRFGYEHLQPMLLLSVIYCSQNKHFPSITIYPYIVIFCLLIIVSLFHHRYGNFFLPPDVRDASHEIRTLKGEKIYLLGASDILYPLSNKLPPFNTYLPTLPWYLGQSKYQAMILDALEKDKPPVIIDKSFTVDNQNVLNFSNNIYQYIKINYRPNKVIGRYDLYLPKE